jgi:GTP cyclohydrolase I
MSPPKNGQVSGIPDPEMNPASTSRLRFSSDSITREGGRAEENVVAVADHFKAILRLLGEDPEREGLLDTPMRAAKAMLFFTKGYDDTIESAVKKVKSVLCTYIN